MYKSAHGQSVCLRTARIIERLWRSLKYEDIYLKGYADGHEAKAGNRRMDPFLQQSAPTSVLGKSNADGGLA
jgi:hypothetical protein